MHRYKNYLQRAYKQLSSNFQQALARAQQSHKVEEADNWLVYSSLTNISFLAILKGAISNAMFDRPNDPPNDLILETEELLQKTRGSFIDLFEDLPDKRPRGHHFLFLTELEKELENINLLASVLERDIKPAPARNLVCNRIVYFPAEILTLYIRLRASANYP